MHNGQRYITREMHVLVTRQAKNSVNRNISYVKSFARAIHPYTPLNDPIQNASFLYSIQIECLQDVVDGEVRAHRLAPGGNNTDFLGLNRIPG